MQIFIDRNGQQFGPYSVDECLVFLFEERLLNEDLAWTEGMEDWQPLHVVLRTALEEDAALVEKYSPPTSKTAAPVNTDPKKTMKVQIPDEWEPIDGTVPPGWVSPDRKIPPLSSH